MSFSISFREDEYLVNMQHTVIPSWYQREGYIKAMATLIENELTKFQEPQKVRAMTSRTCGSLLIKKGRSLLDLVDIYLCYKSLYKAISCVEECNIFSSYSSNKAQFHFHQTSSACKRLSVLLKGVECSILQQQQSLLVPSKLGRLELKTQQDPQVKLQTHLTVFHVLLFNIFGYNLPSQVFFNCIILK
jgi:hypothetical protein